MLGRREQRRAVQEATFPRRSLKFVAAGAYFPLPPVLSYNNISARAFREAQHDVVSASYRLSGRLKTTGRSSTPLIRVVGGTVPNEDPGPSIVSCGCVTTAMLVGEMKTPARLTRKSIVNRWKSSCERSIFPAMLFVSICAADKQLRLN